MLLKTSRGLKPIATLRASGVTTRVSVLLKTSRGLKRDELLAQAQRGFCFSALEDEPWIEATSRMSNFAPLQWVSVLLKTSRGLKLALRSRTKLLIADVSVLLKTSRGLKPVPRPTGP